MSVVKAEVDISDPNLSVYMAGSRVGQDNMGSFSVSDEMRSLLRMLFKPSAGVNNPHSLAYTTTLCH